MSRARYLWVVSIGGMVAAGFTVRHELERFLDGQEERVRIHLEVVRIDTLPLPHKITKLDPFSLERPL